MILTITAGAFLPSLFNGFTTFDDDVYLTENPFIAEPGIESLHRIFGGVYLRHYHPLTLLSFMVERAVWGLWAPGFHLTNLLLHLGSTWLVFGVVRAIGCGTIPAACTALLFGIHPLHVESVAWVTERKDVLSTFFLLAATGLYFRFTTRNRASSYLGSIAAYVVSLLSKALGMTLGGLLWIIEWGRGDRIGRDKILNKAPYIALGAAAASLTLLAQAPVIYHDRTALLGRNLAIAARAFWFYLGKLIWPAGLSALYPYPNQVDVFAPGYLAAIVGVVVFAAATLWSIRRCRAWAAAWAFFILAWLPFSGLVVYGTHFAADRYMYLPSLGPFLLVGLGVERLVRGGLWTRSRAVRLAAAVAAIAIVAGLAVTTAARCRVWKNTETLFRDVLRLYPENTVALNNVALHLADNGRHREAVEMYRRATAADPEDFIAWSNLGACLQAMGRLDQALEADLCAARLRPGNALPWTNLGTLYMQTREWDKARDALERAAQLEPDNEEIRDALARLEATR